MKFIYGLIVLLFVVSCSSDESKPDIGNFQIYSSSHTSQNLHYPNLAIELNVGVNSFTSNYRIDRVNQVEWLLDGKLFSERIDPDLIFNSPGTYEVSVKGSGVFFDGTNEVESSFEAARTFEVIKEPFIYGKIDKPENASFAWVNEENTISIMFEEGSYDEKVLILNDNFGEEVTDFNPGYSYDSEYINQTFVDSEGHLVFNTERSLVTINKSGETLNRIYLKNDINDLIPSDNGVLVLMDSSSYQLVATVNRNLEEIKISKYNLDIDSYSPFKSFFANDTSFFTYLTDENGSSNINLLTGLSFSNKTFMNLYKENMYVDNIWPISDGWLISSSTEAENQTLTKLNSSGDTEWSQSIYLQNIDYLSYVYGPSISIVEKNGHYFIFMDNMRVIKLTNNGEYVWDHYYYLPNSIFHAVVEKGEHFYLVGARQIDPISKNKSYDTYNRDLLVIVIDEEGNIVQ